ncbi:MAG: hypothetical protein H3C58_15675 [Fimbriimonadaceae bacterium]|nr:hypothetical protein [Fimbriimonadaceae bacterium]
MWSALLLLASGMSLMSQPTTAKKVTIERVGEGWTLMRAGAPYRVKGVGGTFRAEYAARSGANSFRTWGAERLGLDLDLASRQGMTVCAGIWLLHKSGLDYSNADQVKAQLDRTRQVVEAHRNHPALLIWSLGNEMEHDNDTPDLWRAVNELAKMTKSLDPNHPTMTVVAEVNAQKIGHIKRYAPDIDILGVNSYGGAPSLPKRLKELGWDKPYIVTEFGPLGPWERPKTPWGAAVEQTSTEKAQFFQNSLAPNAADPACLGTYAFLWGEKQETTPTWFGMFLDSGEGLESVDVMTSFWTGKPVARAPRVERFHFDGSQKEVKPGAKLRAEATVVDPNGDALSFKWVLRPEVTDTRFAGEGEQRPMAVGQWDTGNRAVLEFETPAKPGPYRLYLYATDGTGHAATANAPFLVQAP